MENISLSVKELTKNYSGFCLDKVSFDIPKGSIVGLIGENGAGKSTTIKAILDLIQKDGGSVTFWGKELSSAKEIREDISVVFDEISFYQSTTAAEIGQICKAAYKNWDSQVYEAYLSRFSLPRKQAVKELSKGMKMKLSIAVALSHHAKLLILDEATAGLDPVMRDDILDVFLEFVQDEEHAILMSSHITTDLEKVADYITFIHKGKLLFSKPKDVLIYEYGIIRCGESQFALLDKADVLSYRKEAYQYSVLVHDKEAMKRKYKDVVMDNASIDEIMLLYVKGEQF